VHSGNVLRLLIPAGAVSLFVGVVDASDGTESNKFDPARVNFLLLGLGQRSLVWVWFWKISP